MCGYYQKNILKQDFVSYFGYTFFEVASGSMSDAINVLDLVVIKLDNEDLKIGDVVTYKNGKDFITHRINKINDEKIITKGDANNDVDKPIIKEDIIGKVVFIVPSFGIIRNIIFDSKVILSIVITITLFMSYFIIKNTFCCLSLKEQSCNIIWVARVLRAYEKFEGTHWREK